MNLSLIIGWFVCWALCLACASPKWGDKFEYVFPLTWLLAFGWMALTLFVGMDLAYNFGLVSIPTALVLVLLLPKAFMVWVALHQEG